MVNKTMQNPLIKPFRGLLYNQDRAGNITGLVCPPYDIISDSKPYFERSPFNAIRLELPVGEDGLDGYDTAKRTLDTWLADGIIAPDKRESIYICDQEFLVNGVVRKRRGIIPAVRLDPKRILTHEETRKKAREDREKLIERLSTFTSLVFAMYEDNSRQIEQLLTNCEKEKLYDLSDDLGIRNTFYRMASPKEISELSALMDDKLLYIADGHHRLSVSYKLGLSYLSIYLTDMNADGIAILPYHRVVQLNNPQPMEGLLKSTEAYFDVTELPYQGVAPVMELIEEVSTAAGLSFMVYSASPKPSIYKLTQKKPLNFDPQTPDTLKNLRVNAVHVGVLKNLMSVKDDEFSYLNEPADAIELVDAREYDFAVFVPATSVKEVRDIADNSLYMPPKSTYFYPKVTTGLVFYKYA
jgi:uncharacterized protein (DUF1015 family)